MKNEKASRQLLFELDRNARASYAELGRNLRIPAETVRYRMNALIEAGVIEKFYCIVSMGMLGYSLFKIFLKLESANERNIEEIVRFLNQQKTVVWVVRFDGYFEIGITLRGESLGDISETLDELHERYGQFVAKRSFCANISSEYLPRSYLIGKAKKLERKSGYTVGSKLRPIDEIDRSILEQLGIDCRLSAADLAEGLQRDRKIRAPISREAVLLRLKRLERDRVIQAYSVVLNHEKLNQLHYKTLIRLGSCSGEERNRFLQFCRQAPRVQYIIKSLGEWDYELTIECESVEQYRAQLVEITSFVPRLVKDHCSLMIMKFHHYNLVKGISAHASS